MACIGSVVAELHRTCRAAAQLTAGRRQAVPKRFKHFAEANARGSVIDMSFGFLATLGMPILLFAAVSLRCTDIITLYNCTVIVRLYTSNTKLLEEEKERSLI
jgi:hypothetical protein